MKIAVIDAQNYVYHLELLDEMFQLRARVFHDRLKWKVKVLAGREMDKYDNGSSLYLICTDDEGKEMLGGIRLRSMTGPTLLTTVFRDAIPNNSNLIDPAVWDCTRVCFSERLSRKQTIAAAKELFKCLRKIGPKHGIKFIAGIVEKPMIKWYQLAGFKFEILTEQEYGCLALCPVTHSLPTFNVGIPGPTKLLECE